jgi:TonB family protein
MTLASFQNNLVPWLLQVLVVGSVGAVLPMLFRIVHPRSQVAYFHFLLAACLVLPVIQPWHHPVIAAQSVQKAVESIGVEFASASIVLRPKAPQKPWNQMLLWILAAGVVGRLCWTSSGLWQLRRLRASAKPLYPIPASIKAACSLVKADAAFGTTPAEAGPLTFGYFKHIILLPESFTSLDEQAQLGIACHELLHARRNDWLITLFEEFAAALLWFHPAIWWALSQTRLAREQLVDLEVVQLTAAREPYVNALLTVVGARPTLDLAPAPLFLRRRHLLQRMHFLLTEGSMSKARLLCSYASITAILSLSAWVAIASFPLTGRAEVIPAIPQAQSNSREPQPGYVVNRPPLSYPAEALRRKIEGQVVVELTFNAVGDITDSRVLSGPEELRKAGLESALRGTYNINVARTLQVIIDFKIPPAGQRSSVVPAPAPNSAPGTVPGARGGAPAAPGQLTSPFRGVLETINITGLEGSDLAQMQQRLQQFQGRPMTSELFKEIIDAARSASVSVPYQGITPSDTASNNTALVVSFSNTPVRVRVGGNVIARNLIQKVDPVYPDSAKAAGIQGVVVLEAEISKDGKVENLRAVTGHPLLIQAAMDAVSQWEYRPIMLNSAAVDVVTTISVNFTLPQQ